MSSGSRVAVKFLVKCAESERVAAAAFQNRVPKVRHASCASGKVQKRALSYAASAPNAAAEQRRPAGGLVLGCSPVCIVPERSGAGGWQRAQCGRGWRVVAVQPRTPQPPTREQRVCQRALDDEQETGRVGGEVVVDARA
jgi:hypothetical protein